MLGEPGASATGCNVTPSLTLRVRRCRCLMSDEAAFLAALKANPADDTARLVYADWLDEHDEPRKAEYLRLAAELGRECNDVAAHPHGARILALADALPEEWRTEAGSRFVVTLFHYDLVNKINVIKHLREVVGCGLAEAKAMSESLPNRVLDRVPFERASVVAARLRQAPTAVVSILPTDLESLPYTVTYEVYVLRYLYNEALTNPRIEQASRSALGRFVAATVGGNLVEAAFNSGARHTVLVSDLTLEEANARVQEFRRHLPPYDQQRGWYLWVGSRHVAIKNNL
jgi:uncharacterized protein (TIGR02996 family)